MVVILVFVCYCICDVVIGGIIVWQVMIGFDGFCINVVGSCFLGDVFWVILLYYFVVVLCECDGIFVVVYFGCEFQVVGIVQFKG